MKYITRVFLFLIPLGLAWPAIARAQMFEPLRFTTTFPFEAGHRLMPAGTYLLDPLNGVNGGNVFTLSDARTVTFMIGDGLGASPDGKARTSEVIFAFDHAAGHYVMCQVWDAGEQSGIQLHGTYDLTRAAKTRAGNLPDTPELIVPASPAIR
jgi:hypothetical protein